MNWDKQTKFTVKFTLILALLAVVYTLGAYNNQVNGKNAPQSDKMAIEQMSTVCGISHNVNNGELEDQCGKLIDQVQGRGYEVMYNGSNFWAESK